MGKGSKALLCCCWYIEADAFQPIAASRNYNVQFHQLTRQPSLNSTYGRGAEIWPECNEDPVELSGSFPNGEIPLMARKVLNATETIKDEPTADEDTNKTSLTKEVYNLLHQAADAQEEEASLGSPKVQPSVEISPALIAVLLLIGGLVQPVDILLAVFLSFYTTILSQFARATRRDGVSPTLPALPPQGHVPAMISNPLGATFTHSNLYAGWLKAGAFFGLLGPVVMIARYSLYTSGQKRLEAAKACARPLFLLCCQAISETISRRSLTPLPIRILIPIAYNTIRLGPLWSWLLLPQPLGVVGRMLAATNFLYWSINLFAFLLPVACLRYMRAHFLCVEAEEVTLRKGFEDSVGVLP